MVTTWINRIASGTALAVMWAVVAVGCIGMAFTLASVYMLARGTKPGESIFLDELAPTPQGASLKLLYYGALIVLPFALRSALRWWWKGRASSKGSAT